ncbi:MAG: hypothetical protein GQ572_09145 [Gammaproteobacteria bacterium]|nr:hypothetical protein [Gammaproteobacteria bacterium]
MSICNTSSDVTRRNKFKCPVNGKQYAWVSDKTILLHIKEPWSWDSKKQDYYFCEDPECDVVYFGEDESIITKSAVRTVVGIKEKSDNALICYCFGVTRRASTDSQIKSFVIKNTKDHTCACEIRNPSGRCCLKDFP